MKTLQAKQASDLIATMRVLDARALEIENTPEVTELRWTPPEGGWSAGQVFEHLCVANDSYLTVLRAVVDQSRSSVVPDDTTWSPSLMGRLLARSMESTRKLPAPKQWQPAPEPRANVIPEFLARQREIVGLIERSSGSRWQGVRMASPVSSLVRMNIGDAFTILVKHEQRHFRQIDRVLERSRGHSSLRSA